MDILIKAAQLVLSLSLLVVLHELGHFLPARWFGCRVEKFYLFFDPYFSLFKKKIGETEYGIGWLPLGGYVKISGMIDESMDTEQLEGPVQPYEFRSKPAWQRLIIMLGGVTVNFVLGFLIFGGMLWYWGTSYLPLEEATHGIYAEELGERYGLKTGDQVLAIDTVRLDRFGEQEIRQQVLFNGARTLTVERDGETLELRLPDSLQRNLTKKAYAAKRLFSLPIRPLVDTAYADYPAAEAGVRAGDLVLAAGPTPTPWLQDLKRALRDADADAPLALSVLRGGDTVELTVQLDSSRVIGIAPDARAQYDHQTEEYGAAAALGAGVDRGLEALAMQGRAVGQMFADNIDVEDSLGSFISIGDAFGGTWDWQRFWQLTALLSLILAVMNILPIPVLDGGHVMFLLYEMVSGRKPGDKFVQVTTTIGFGLVLCLMAFAIFNDIRRVL